VVIVATNDAQQPGLPAPFTWSDVEAILAAAGGAKGPGSLTGLTLPEFLALQLHGMPLVAPLTTTCCGKSNAEGRGARSALIRGLRGLSPFDGKQFPRLPWGGSPVADEDIDRIETWIEEGCPEGVIGSVALAGEVSVTTEARVQVKGLAGPVFGSASDPAAWRYAKGELRQRMDVDVLDEPQKERLRYAFRELYKLNKWIGDKRSYNNRALIHQKPLSALLGALPAVASRVSL
jgi:tyrosinase